MARYVGAAGHDRRPVRGTVNPQGRLVVTLSDDSTVDLGQVSPRPDPGDDAYLVNPGGNQ